MTSHPAHRHSHTEAMLTVEEALERILSFFEALEPARMPIAEAGGMVISEDVVSHLDVPPLDNSAMDGYAVSSQSVSSAAPHAPATLRVIDKLAAGDLPTTPVGPGTAIRIMTGAPVPRGADAVVPFEDTDEVERRLKARTLDEISVRHPAGPGSNVRQAGRDLARGQTVLRRGTVIGPSQVGLLASLGHATVSVHRRPVVAILSTGDELVEPGLPLPEGRIYDSNGAGIAAAVMEAGGTPRQVGTARDDLESVNAKIDEGIDSDMLITSAGVSKGDFDMVKDVLTRRGSMQFWSVRMRPAKPLAFGLLSASDGSGRTVPHLGLPGNPVSALVAFEQFGRLAIAKMLGRDPAMRPRVRAVLTDPIHNTDGRRVYARAVVTKRDGRYYASLTGDQSSNLLTSMAAANGLAICPEDLALKQAGDEVDVLMLRWPPEVF